MTEAKPPHRYAPYHLYPEFYEGLLAYKRGEALKCPYDPNSISAQAWDRGAQWAMETRSAPGELNGRGQCPDCGAVYGPGTYWCDDCAGDQ